MSNHALKPAANGCTAEAANRDANAPERRVSAKYLKGVTRRARERARLTQEQLALALGVRRQFVAETESPNEPDLPRVDHLASAPSEYRQTFVAELAALDGCQVVPAPTVKHNSHQARIASLTSTIASLMSAYTLDIVDGRLDDARTHLAHAQTLIADLQELVAAMQGVL